MKIYRQISENSNLLAKIDYYSIGLKNNAYDIMNVFLDKILQGKMLFPCKDFINCQKDCAYCVWSLID